MTDPLVSNALVFDDQEDLDTIELGGFRSPGRVTLSGHDRENIWDVKEAKGKAGATTTLTGEKVCQFTATFYLVTDLAQGIDDWEEWQDFAAVINSLTSGPKPMALDVYHPDLVRNKIRAVSKGTMGGVVHDGKGGRTIAVKFIEHFPPKPKGGTPKGNKPDPNADVKKEVAELTKQAQQP